MIAHEHEFMELIFLLIAIVKQDVEEEQGHSVGLEYGSAMGAGGGQEVGIHNRYLGG